MSADAHDKLLDQLQQEVNRVLEHTGKLFAAVAADNGKASHTGHVIKLKKLFPESNRRFHEALDELEQELQTAQLVMRRDLAVCRERLQLPPAENLSPAVKTLVEESEPIVAKIESVELEITAPERDVEMKDSEPAEDQSHAIESISNDHFEPTESRKDDPAVQQTITENDQPNGTEEKSISQSEPQPEVSANEPAPAELDLHIDTQASADKTATTGEAPTDDDKPPDTGTFSNTNDLESLFGGPLSAGAAEAPDFNLGTTTADDFDFDAFATSLAANNTADSDNIASLLPGLEDYATTQPAGDEIDFDSYFSTNLAGNGDGPAEGSQIPHRDSTFDGLDDLGDFDVSQFTAGAEGNGEGENQEFDFLMD